MGHRNEDPDAWRDQVHTNNNRGGRGRSNAAPQLPARVSPTELGLPERGLSDPELVQDALEHAMEAGANVLAPMVALDHMPPDHVVGFRVCQFPTDGEWDGKSNGHWYRVKGGGLAMHRSTLDMIAAAAGITTTDSKVETIGIYHWQARVEVEVRGFDGRPRTGIGSVEFDVRDGSEEAKAAGNGLDTVRRYGARHAETKARNRAIQNCLGLRKKYTEAEAARPFVFPIMLWVPDTSDPEIKRLVAAKELGIVDELYGAMAPAQAPHTGHPDNLLDIDPDDEPEPHTRPVERGVPPRPDNDPRLRPGWRRKRQPDPEPKRDHCAECDLPLSKRQGDWSRAEFGRPLCGDHEPEGGDR